jgi:hypothetical protein
MTDEQAIYEDIGAVLIRGAPPNTKLVKFGFDVRVDINGEDGGVYDLFFDYVNSGNEENWFEMKSSERQELYRASLKLRKMMAAKNGEFWRRMDFVVDFEKQSFGANFKY